LREILIFLATPAADGLDGPQLRLGQIELALDHIGFPEILANLRVVRVDPHRNFGPLASNIRAGEVLIWRSDATDVEENIRKGGVVMNIAPELTALEVSKLKILLAAVALGLGVKPPCR
jgi:hypothetical protein